MLSRVASHQSNSLMVLLSDSHKGRLLSDYQTSRLATTSAEGSLQHG